MAKKKAKKKDDVIRAEGLTDADIAQPIKEKLAVDPGYLRLERQLRVYVKRSGGMRKGLTETAEKKAMAILKKLKREKLEWDETVDVHLNMQLSAIH